MPPEELACEVEGVLQISPTHIRDLVVFEGDVSGDQQEWFCRAVEARKEDGEPGALMMSPLFGRPFRTWLDGSHCHIAAFSCCVHALLMTVSC